VSFAYHGRSRLEGGLLSFAPNLSREAVAFDAPLVRPLRFREGISALHDVVISDLRYKPRDHAAYEEWKKGEQVRRREQLQQFREEATQEILARRGIPAPPDLERQFEVCRKRYWSARLDYSSYLQKNDQELWRLLVPCDPIVTVADDVVFFECFSADESSYGCLTVERGAFGPAGGVQLGTTNVDYSWDLYHHFQALRTYRETRLKVDPAGFEVATQGSSDYREEKIDLPAGWLRGLAQVQAAMTLPMRRVSLTREAVYSLLAWLKRHKAQKSPRALRFELWPDCPPRLVLEPWETAVYSYGTTYSGPPGEPIRIWGRQRLLVLARLLPLADQFDVYLLGTGLPSFWVARMGEMRLTVGLSGWTTNDWTRNAALDVVRPPVKLSEGLTSGVAQAMRTHRTLAPAATALKSVASEAECAAALNHLAHAGQVIYDVAAGVYRWRQIMPRALGEAEIGPENAELAASRGLVAKVKIDSRQEAPRGGTVYTAVIDRMQIEMLLDADGIIKRGKCKCSHHFKGGLRMGPCRHLLALRAVATKTAVITDASAQSWFERLQGWAQN